MNDYDDASVPAPYIGIHFTNGTGGDFLQIELPYKIYLKSINITARTSASLIDRAPHTGFIFGSNDSGTTWSQVTSWSGLNWTVGESKPIQINSNTLYSTYRLVANKLSNSTGTANRFNIDRWQLFGTPGPTTLDKGSLSLTHSLDVPRVSRYDVDTETPRPEKLVVDFDTTNDNNTADISGKGRHGEVNGAYYSAADRAFIFDGSNDYIYLEQTDISGTSATQSWSLWFKSDDGMTNNEYHAIFEGGVRSTNQAFGAYLRQVGSNLRVFYHRKGNNLPDANDGHIVTPNRWYHIAGTTDMSGV